MSLILTLSVISGQLIKLPIGNSLSGPSLLDFFIFVLALTGLLIDKLHKPNLSLQFGLGFSLIIILSLILTPLHLQGSEFITSSLYILRFIALILLAWEINVGAFQLSLISIVNILTWSGVTVAVLGLIQFIFIPDLRFLSSLGWDPHYFRNASTFLDPNFVGAYYSLTLVLLLTNFSKLNKKSTIIFLIVYLSLLTTFSRSSYLMFSISFLAISIIKKSLRLLALTTVLITILILGFYVYVQLVSTPKNIDRSASANARLNTWQQGFILFEKSPILGIGFNAYRFGLIKYHLADSTFSNSHGASTNDFSLLYVLATTGLIGLISYSVFIASILYLSFKNFLKQKGIGLALFAGLIGLLAHSFFNNSLFYSPILFWIILSLSQLDCKEN